MGARYVDGISGPMSLPEARGLSMRGRTRGIVVNTGVPGETGILRTHHGVTAQRCHRRDFVGIVIMSLSLQPPPRSNSRGSAPHRAPTPRAQDRRVRGNKCLQLCQRDATAALEEVTAERSKQALQRRPLVDAKHGEKSAEFAEAERAATVGVKSLERRLYGLVGIDERRYEESDTSEQLPLVNGAVAVCVEKVEEVVWEGDRDTGCERVRERERESGSSEVTRPPPPSPSASTAWRVGLSSS